MNEIFIYWYIGPFLAEQFATQMNEFKKDEEITVCMNSPGGDVYAGWTMISRVKDHTGKKNLKIEGHTASMAPIFIPYFDYVTALNVTQFWIHRADAIVRSDAERKALADINMNLLKALKRRINEAKFEEITGETLEDIFNAREQYDVFLTAEQAQAVGLVDELIDMHSEKGMQEVEASQKKFVAFSNKFLTLQPKAPKAHKVIFPKAQQDQPKTETDMSKETLTVAQIKAQHPEVYEAIFKAGVDSEKDRVLAYLEFMDIDPKTVKSGIEAGKQMTQAEMAKLVRLSASGPGAATAVKENEEDNAESVSTEEPTGSTQPGATQAVKTEAAAKNKNLSPAEKEKAESQAEAKKLFEGFQAKRNPKPQTT